MNINELPPTVYVAIGTLLASLIAGVFSYLNMIVSKENKVSEFRLGWIDGLRNEIAEYTASMQNLSYIIDEFENIPNNIETQEHLNWLTEIIEQRTIAIGCITKIRLRLNHKEVELNENSVEKKLIIAIESARAHLNDGKYDDVMEDANTIRINAAPLLKSSWETVKSGEKRYLKIKRRTEIILIIIFLSIPTELGYLLHVEHSKNLQQQNKINTLIKEIDKKPEAKENLPNDKLHKNEIE